MSAVPPSNIPVRKHTRDVRWRIVAPVAGLGFVLVALCVALAIGVATGNLERSHVTVVMGLLATAFISLPLVILCLVPYLLLAALAQLAGQGHAQARGPLRRVRHLTEQVAVATDKHAPRLARPLIGLNVRLTRWEHAVRGVLPPLPAEKDATHE